MTQRTVKTWSTGDASISNTFVNNRQQGINWQYDAEGHVLHGNDGYVYDAAGRNSYVETPSFTTATMSYDGDGRQVKTVETSYDEEWNQYTETQYYVRSTVLGGQVLAEVEASYSPVKVNRTFVYAGPAVLGWIWHAYSFDLMVWEQRDPSGATVRGNGEQELDPLGADAGTFAFAVPPSERVIVSYGTSYDPGNPAMTYSVDGIRVPVEDFIQHAGFILRDPLGLLEDFARRSAIPVGSRNVGVRWGKWFEVITDANDKVVSARWGRFDPSLAQVSYGVESPTFSDQELDITLLEKDIPKPKNATPDQQKRFNEAYADLWKRLHANGGKNACADLFGGVKKAEKALKDTNYLFERIKSGDPAETKGKLITIDPTGLFMTEKDNAKFQVGVNLPAQQAYYVVMNNIEAAAFILAHEIGHRTDTLERDGHDQSGFLSVTNSGRVRDACFAEVPTAIELLRPGF